MKILAPLSKIENYEPLFEAGADEFFAGFVPYEWVKQYNAVLPINRREYIFGDFNIASVNSMKALSKKVSTYGASVKITFNAHYYLPEQYETIAETIKMLMVLGFDTFIISDIALVLYLRQKGIDCVIHLSGELQILNEFSLRYLDQFDIKRVVFPRLASFEDMRNVIQGAGFQDKEYEAFILNSFCPLDGGLCNSIHCEEVPKLCWIKANCYRYDETSARFKEEAEQLPAFPQSMQYNEAGSGCSAGQGCGLCALKQLKEIGITNLKVVGRGEAISEMVADVRKLREALTLSESIADPQQYAHTVLDKFYHGNCSGRLCYYPEAKPQPETNMPCAKTLITSAKAANM